MMSGSTIIFYLLAALTLVSGVLAVTYPANFQGGYLFIIFFDWCCGFYFWMQYEFIAAVQIVVYVGGITVLIIFSIFLTQQAGEKMPRQKLGRQIFSALAAFCGFALIMIQVFQHTFTGTENKPIEQGVASIGTQMLSTDNGGYALPFEVVSMLLLAALVGCIVIALKPPKEISNIEAEILNNKIEKQKSM